ncbi:type II toxin-antitoxin system PemK/MazF family toxin [Lachnospiraceae bacterium C1.1]|nr:type II toxin-antitoxin system PemK/MazF family toxin [Lachnospiraceae bacterium C1.1]
MRDDWIYRRGDVYYVDFGPYRGSIQGGIRPAIVMQNDIGNFYSPLLVVVPLTSEKKKEGMVTHAMLDNIPFLKFDSMALAEQPQPVNKKQIKKYLGKLNKEQIAKVEKALLQEFGISYIPECVEAP